MDDCVKAKQSKERKTEREEEKDGPDGALLAAFHIFWGINCKHPDGDFCVNICRHFRIFNVKIADQNFFERERKTER